MGCITTKDQPTIHNIIQPKKTQQHRQNYRETKLKFTWTCPNCMTIFVQGSQLTKFQQHVKICITEADRDQQAASKTYSRNIDSIKKKKKKQEQYIFEKSPDGNSGIQFKWQKVKQSRILKKSTLFDIKEGSFQQKQAWFETQLNKLRISWEHGCEWIKIDRKDILKSSIQQFRRVNLRKQVKIKFDNQKANDAGGLLRQFIHLATKQIFSPSLKLFIRAETEQLTYKLQKCKNIMNKNILYFFGQIIGKSLFQKIPLSTYMDRTIMRQLCNQDIILSDIHSFDKNLYKSWEYIIQNNLDSPSQQGDYAQFYFTIMLQRQEDGKFYDHQLIPNGANIKVDQKNKKYYIEKCINYMCHERIKESIQTIKSGLYSVIPSNLLNIFQPHQLEMLMCGVPFIDVQDWQMHTQYKGAYYEYHKNIIWFWQYVKTQPQQKLCKLLHFCTGTTRVPLHGFKKLQTNRGEHSKFIIQSSTYIQQDPYPKGHTCFNRLELPVYPHKNLLEQYLAFIMEANLEGVYGLD